MGSFQRTHEHWGPRLFADTAEPANARRAKADVENFMTAEFAHDLPQLHDDLS